jgi:drug/metabolite transporter (DMT)-like permease
MIDPARYKAVALLILLALIWGTSFILIKKGLIGFAPQEVGALRVAAASLALLPVALFHVRSLRPKHYGKLLLSGLLGIFFPAFLFAAAQTHLSSSVTGIFNSLTPLLTLVVGALIFGQSIRSNSIAGILTGLAGTVVLIGANAQWSLQGVNGYVLLILVACFMYATNVNFIKYRIPELKSLAITSVSLLLIGPLAIIYLFAGTDFLSRFNEPEIAWPSFGYIVLLGLMGTSVAGLIFNHLVKISSPLFTSSVTYLIPIVAILWGVLDGETLTWGHVGGMIAIIGGVYLANRK